MNLVKNPIKQSGLKTDAKRQKEELERRKLGNQPAIKLFTETLDALKLKYEQYFLGIEKFAPETEHDEFKRMIRKMKMLLQKSSEDNFRINAIEQKYLTLNNLWEKTLRQKEKGTYKRDIFKAKIAADPQYRHRTKTQTDIMESNLVDKLFEDFRSKVKLDLCPNNRDKLKRILLVKLKELKKKHNNLDFSIEIAVKDGKIGLKTHQ